MAFVLVVTQTVTHTEKFKASQQPLTVQWDVLEMQAAAASASVVWLLAAHTTDLRPYLGPAWSLSSLSQCLVAW